LAYKPKSKKPEKAQLHNIGKEATSHEMDLHTYRQMANAQELKMIMLGE
jgi:hypothetical protein